MGISKSAVAQNRVDTRPKLQSYHFRISPEIYERLQWKAVEFGIPLADYVRGLFKRATANARRPDPTENQVVPTVDPLAPFAELPVLCGHPDKSVVAILQMLLDSCKAEAAA